MTVIQLDPVLAKYADARVPRYTSYPTAPHFTNQVNCETYAGWLNALDPGAPVSLYVHIPYCRELCWYCGCHTSVARRYQRVVDYIGLVAREIELVAEQVPGRPRASHLHFGGGTPSLLTGEDFALVMERLGDAFTFDADSEVAVEVDPRGLDKDRIAAMAGAGVTRVSLGVQDLSPRVQQAINRVQPYELVAEAMAALRAAGITALNVDLMYGLPHQGLAEVEDSARRMAALKPSRVSLFGYAHVPWMKKHQRMIQEAALPDAALRQAQFDSAAAILKEAGYVAIGLDHFALADDPMAKALADETLHRNFQGYTTDRAETLIGLGASAIGQTPSGYVQNAPHVAHYGRRIRADRLATQRGLTLTEEDRVRRRVIEEIMCFGKLDLAPALAKVPSLAEGLERLSPLVEDGLVEVEETRIELTPRGKPLIRSLAAVFDAYLQEGEQRHAKAV